MPVKCPPTIEQFKKRNVILKDLRRYDRKEFTERLRKNLRKILKKGELEKLLEKMGNKESRIGHDIKCSMSDLHDAASLLARLCD